MMVHSLCSSYHWSYEQAMKMTLPQIILLNHCASVQGERLSRRYKKDVNVNINSPDSDEPVWHGKRISEMDSAETARYMDGFFD